MEVGSLDFECLHLIIRQCPDIHIGLLIFDGRTLSSLFRNLNCLNART